MERGGYRLVRVLGGSGGEEVSLCTAPDGEPVVLRLVREAAADAAVTATAADSVHLARLLDLFSLPEDRFGLVYPRLPGGTLSRLLARRATLRPGEATTILVSVLRGLAALHAAGVSHGALRPSGVLFGEDGTPVLADLTSCSPLTEERVAADLRDFAAVAAAVLSRVPRSEALLAHVSAPDAPMADLEAVLFDAADACPVERPAPDAPTIEQLLPSRTFPPAAMAPAPPEGPGWPASLAERTRGLLGSLRRVRRRVWVPALLVGVGLTAAVVLVPGDHSGAATVPTPAGTSVQPVPVPEAEAVSGDDPAAAAVALASARDECLASGAAECLSAVDQPGSTLLETDLAGVGPPAPTLPDPAVPAEVQRTGDAALVTVGEVRLLLVRVDEQWRLRDVFAAEPP